MSDLSQSAASGSLVEAVILRPATIDDFSDIRYVQTESVRRIAARMLSEDETAAFVALVCSQSYAGRLVDLVRAGRLTVAVMGEAGSIVGTAGWVPANDSGAVARLVAMFVGPQFARQGIGRRLFHAVEAQSSRAGFSGLTVRSPIGATGFFLKLGFEVASHGVWGVGPDVNVPVAFMRRNREQSGS
ncbi:MAG: GNAT family N-acetyltransferase [Hyphomicrobiaceae bacterium]